MSGFSNYDIWKTTPPWDRYGVHEPDPCEHQDYEINWEGRAECPSCGETWWPRPEVVKAYAEAQRRHDREARRYNSWYMRAWRWLTERRQRVMPNDDIPF